MLVYVGWFFPGAKLWCGYAVKLCPNCFGTPSSPWILASTCTTGKTVKRTKTNIDELLGCLPGLLSCQQLPWFSMVFPCFSKPGLCTQPGEKVWTQVVFDLFPVLTVLKSKPYQSHQQHSNMSGPIHSFQECPIVPVSHLWGRRQHICRRSVQLMVLGIMWHDWMKAKNIMLTLSAMLPIKEKDSNKATTFRRKHKIHEPQEATRWIQTQKKLTLCHFMSIGLSFNMAWPCTVFMALSAAVCLGSIPLECSEFQFRQL